MNATQEFLSILLAVGLVIIMVCLVFTTYYLIKALQSITSLADTLEDTTQNIKNKIQMKALAAIPALLVAIAGKIMKQAFCFAIKRKRG